tara:strand:- start:2839 stop:3519 length:681 start_codon:yes stop_codon:yes gene_type:complete
MQFERRAPLPNTATLLHTGRLASIVREDKTLVWRLQPPEITSKTSKVEAMQEEINELKKTLDRYREATRAVRPRRPLIGNSYRDEIYEKLTFEGQVEQGTSNAFTRCTFRNVTFSCDGDDYIVFYDCTFQGHLRFEGDMPQMFFVGGVHTGGSVFHCLETGSRRIRPFVATTNDRDYTEWDKMDWNNLLQGGVTDQAYGQIFMNLIYTENEDDPDLPGTIPETEEE